MANLQIYQLPQKSSVSATDMFALDDASIGHVTWKVTAQQISDFVNSGATSSPAQIIYVANTGNDSTGTGSLASPFATISHALSSITTNSSSIPFLIYVIPGVYNETSLIIKPWVYIEGNNARLNLTTSVSLDIGWTTGVGQGLVQDLTISLSPDAFNLNFTIGTGQSSTLIMNNINIISVPAVRVTGTSLETILFDNVSNSGGSTSTVIQDVNGKYGNSNFNSFSFTNTRNDNPLTFFLYNINELGSITINSTGSQLTEFYMKSVITQGTISASGIPTNLFLDGASTNVIPSISSGATVTLLGKSNNYNANIAPSNYTPIDGSIHGNLVGIDNKFNTVLLKENNLSDVNNIITSATNLGVANGVQSFTANTDQNITVPIPSTIIVNIPSNGHFLILPDSTTLNPNEVGKKFLILNNGSTTVGVKNFTGSVISILSPNAQFFMIPLSNSTPSGSWQLTSIVSSINGQVGNVTLNSDMVTQGVNNLYLSTDGGLTTNQSSFNNFTNQAISAGLNVTITQPGGPGTPSVISSSGGVNASATTLAVMLTPTTSFVNGVFTSFASTMTGSNILPPNTMMIGDTYVLTIAGNRTATVTPGTNILFAVFGGPSGTLICQSPTITSSIAGTNSTRNWNLTFTVSVATFNQFVCSCVGWYEDDNHIVQSFRMYTTPVFRTFNSSVSNLMDVPIMVNNPPGSTFNYTAYSYNLVRYRV